jgi:predicted NBD/HSP70 family sugar kinase
MVSTLSSGEPVGLDLFNVLELLRRTSPMTRPQLVEQTGLGRRVVTERVDQLIQSGLVSESDALSTTKRGRPASRISFNFEAGRVLVAELGASGMSIGISDLAGNLLATADDPCSADLGPEIVLTQLERRWSDLVEQFVTSGSPLRAIGLGVRGPVDPADGRTIEVHHVSGWENYPVRDRLEARFGVPAWVENDVNVIAVGEHRRQNHKATPDMVFIRVDDGIGAGIISGGRLVRGAGGVAGEIGHIRVTDDPAAICFCGNTGCLFAVSSALVIGDACKHLAGTESGGNERVSIDQVTAAAESGDEIAIRTLQNAGWAIGIAVASLVNLFNPSEVVIGGSVAHAGDILFEPMRESLAAATYRPARRQLSLMPSFTEERLNLIGAAITAIDGLLSSEFSHNWLHLAQNEVVAISRG